MLADMQRGRISLSDETAFEVGRNVATTPRPWCSRTNCSS
jgi:polyhydroxyalkanoate synthase